MGIMDRIFPPTPASAFDPSEAASVVATSVAANSHRSLTASGKKINLRNEDEVAALRYRVYSEWQNDAWGYYDAIGEIKYGFGMLASVTSRVRIYPALNLDPDSVPIGTLDYRRRKAGLNKNEVKTEELRELTVPDTITDEVMAYMEELIEDLATGPGGISGFLRTFALNMSVPGECYLVEIDGAWTIKSADELVVDPSGEVRLRRQRTPHGVSSNGSGTGLPGDIILPADTNMVRIWREHPRYSLEPESSMLGLREACDELLTLQRMIRAVARSSMNAGILFVPDTLTAAGSTIAEDIEDEENMNEELIQVLYDNLIAPITDETSTSSVVPTILTGPAEAGKSLQYIEINRRVDQFLTERCDRALERVLQGIDMPKDFVTGLANVRYTNAKNIDESLYKSHIEPSVLMLVDALNVGYFTPALKKKFPKLSSTDLRKLTVWYDPSEIVTKSDPADSADKGFDKYAISSDAWRQAHGFSDTDAPSERETAIRMLQKAPLPPELVTSLFNIAFPEILKEQRETALQKNPGGFPDSARNILYNDDDTDDTTADPDAPEPEVEETGTPPAAPEPTTAPALAASAGPRGLYSRHDYNGNDLQSIYRAIAEHAVRSGDCEHRKFDTAELLPTQPRERTGIAGSGAGAKDLMPIVIKHDGKDYLLDGHHRASRRNKIAAAYVDTDNLRTEVADIV